MFRSLRGIVGTLLIAALVLVPVAGVMLAVDGQPRITFAPPPDAAVASRTRDLALTLRAVVESGAATGTVTVDAEQLNALLISGRRLRPGLSGEARIQGTRLDVDVSAGAPILPDGIWGNLRLGIADSDQGLRVVSARIGRLPLPAALVVPALRLALDRYLGDGLGAVLIDGIDEVRIGDGRVTVAFAFDEADRVALYERFKDRVRAFAGGTDAQRIFTHLAYFDREGDRRALPRRGSVLPYLRQVVEWSAPRSAGEDREELRAALLALTLYCGEDGFGPAVGANLSEGMQGKGNHCDGTTLGGRDDLKRHFIVSAGIYAARTGTTAFGMGELKELLDSNVGGTGFSFDDIAADLAGARFARTFLEAPRGDWPALLGMITEETDVLPPLEDLPSGMSEAEFRGRFGDVESTAYAAQIAEITRRIDAMPLYRPLAQR